MLPDWRVAAPNPARAGCFELVSAIVAHTTPGENVGVGVSDN